MFGSKFERSPADPLQSGFSLFRKEKRPQKAFRGGAVGGILRRGAIGYGSNPLKSG
jgi:hypothetical protein